MVYDRRLLAQESNSIRLTAFFGVLTISFGVILTLLTRPANGKLILLSIAHFPLAFVAAFLSVVSSNWSKWTIGIFAVQGLFDLAELVLRIVPLTPDTLLQFKTILELLFLLINFALLVISTVYVIFIYRYITVFDAAMEAHLIGPGGDDEGDYKQSADNKNDVDETATAAVVESSGNSTKTRARLNRRNLEALQLNTQQI